MIWDLQIDYPFHHILEYTQYKIVWRQFMKRKKNALILFLRILAPTNRFIQVPIQK